MQRASGRQCSRCYNYGHTGRSCPINPNNSKSCQNNLLRSDFKFAKSYAIDSASNVHVTNDRSVLIIYIELKIPREIQFNLAGKPIYAKAIGIGRLPLLVKWRKVRNDHNFGKRVILT